LLPHPALSKGEGSKKREVKILSFGEDLGEAKRNANANFLFRTQVNLFNTI
jgi:hypothetical protein